MLIVKEFNPERRYDSVAFANSKKCRSWMLCNRREPCPCVGDRRKKYRIYTKTGTFFGLLLVRRRGYPAPDALYNVPGTRYAVYSTPRNTLSTPLRYNVKAMLIFLGKLGGVN